MIVFLDFDGVLHPDRSAEGEHFVQLPRFEGVIREFADVGIVISSSWRYYFTLRQLTAHFSADIRLRIAGVTPLLDDDVPRTRYQEIRLYQQKLGGPPRRWVAVDDAVLEFPKRCSNLVLCNPTRGFDSGAAEKLRSHLLDARSGT